MAQVQEDNLETLLGKFTLWRTLRVCAWIERFIHNARSTRSNRNEGPLITEVSKQRILWLKRFQESFKTSKQTNGSKNIGCCLIFNQTKMGCLSVEGGSKVYAPLTYQNRNSLRASLLKRPTFAHCVRGVG